MRVALFDIDGTLLSMGTAARESFTCAVAEAAGRSIDASGVSFGGKTDPQIAREILSRNGVEEARLSPLVAETLRLYLAHFERALPGTSGARLLPGVVELLQALADRDDVAVALLTGNLERGARLKLGHFDLVPRFRFDISAFGSDHEDRYVLPAVALGRARARHGESLAGSDLVILGDSEHDVLCGRGVGARSVAVATGWTPAAKLRALRPDVLLADFADTAGALRAILD
ncbi:MAG TPA: haloacid dehalogenase-like hydrolase [Candidatus Polarisedimenticolia bacterium]|jgi:phosphoglycolate phosphatase-like HAD superfamily hydrolase|nr:haloacid dehalogenase-like hydrolase [Candidatus Polarisedimenticolia bacterium]